MANNINTMQIWCYINYHWNNTKIKSIQSKLFQCLFYTNKALNLGHLVKVLWKHLNSTNTKGSPLCDEVGNGSLVEPFLIVETTTTQVLGVTGAWWNVMPITPHTRPKVHGTRLVGSRSSTFILGFRWIVCKQVRHNTFQNSIGVRHGI
jgi:hypothetical protein